MLVVKVITRKQTQRQTGGREGSQFGMGSATSGDHISLRAVGSKQLIF